MKPSLLLIAVLLITALFSDHSAAQAGQGCSNTKATQVPVEVTKSGSSERCGIGLVIFGFGGAIIGSKCKQFETMTPAHQTCSDEASLGNSCVLEGTEKVQTRECSCGGLVIPGIEIGIPTSCVCGDWYPNGTVEDFKTAPCS